MFVKMDVTKDSYLKYAKAFKKKNTTVRKQMAH